MKWLPSCTNIVELPCLLGNRMLVLTKRIAVIATQQTLCGTSRKEYQTYLEAFGKHVENGRRKVVDEGKFLVRKEASEQGANENA